MATLTPDGLIRIINSAGGNIIESRDLQDALDTPFDDLGFDSLALLETAKRIEIDFRVYVSDSALEELSTPRLLLDYENAQAAIS
jgi:act minimal PKS acyl carrier protein